MPSINYQLSISIIWPTALSFVLVCCGPEFASWAQSVSNGFWQAQSIYQIVTDRFFDGDPANNNADGNYNPRNNTSVHGGDFKGIEQKLDYIKSLGATAIWISPVVLNANGEYHGYAAKDFYKVDPHWGSLANLQNMVRTAHTRGILVIDDIVVNHGADLIYSTAPGYAAFLSSPAGYTLRYRSGAKVFGPPFDIYNATYNSTNNALTNLFHNHGAIGNFNDNTQVVQGELFGLDDFATEDTYVRTQMAQIYNSWITEVGFDGFRIDTTKHVEMGFWQTWCPTVHAYAAGHNRPNFFMFGEVFDGSDAKCGAYTGTMGGGPFKQDSVLDYPLYFALNNVFGHATGNTKQIEDHYHAIAANYDPSAQMRLVTFLDNHDQPRFLSPSVAANNLARLQVALVFLYTSRGIPCLYYGTEQAFNGGGDPFDREDMFAGQFKDGPPGVDSFNMTHPLFQLIAMLNNFRRLYPALQLGSHVNQWNSPTGPGLFAYARRLDSQEIFVVLNTANSVQTLTNRSTIYPFGTRLVNLLDLNETLVIQASQQTPAVSVLPTTAKIFVAESQLLPLDPVVTASSPTHDATNVPTWTPIVLHFSKPMDTNRVQAAFGINPPAGGVFSWSAANDVMTFTPGGLGLAGVSNIVVRIENSANDAISGKPLFAPFELMFETAMPFEIIKGVIVADDALVSFPTAANHSYQLQRRNSLDPASSWTNVGQSIGGTGAIMVLTDPGGATNLVRYYRVQTGK
jgi:glycosidase